MSDITDTLTPKSQQLDAVDLLDGPRTFTVTGVDVNKAAEQPVTVHLAEFPRPWKPGKNMRRVLAYCWKADSSKWVGRRVTLFYDSSVRYAGEEVGGARISHLSDISGAQKAPIIPTRGKSALYTVQPLPDLTPEEKLRAEWKGATPERRKEIEAEVAALGQGGAA